MMKNILVFLTLFLLVNTLSITSYSIYEGSLEYHDFGFDNCNMQTNGEADVISHFIKKDDLIFDIGANVGSWSQQVISVIKSPRIFAFEPIPDTYIRLQNNLEGEHVFTFNSAFTSYQGIKEIAYYNTSPALAELSSFYPRPMVEEIHNIKPNFLTVVTHTLDSFCLENNINKINFVKIDTEGSELDILKGAKSCLAKKAIDYIQFEYGGTYHDANTTLQEIYSLLNKNGYLLYRIVPSGLIKIPKWSNDLENYRYSNYLAIAHEDLLFIAQGVRQLPLVAVKSGQLGWAGGALNKLFLQTIKNLFDVTELIETGTYAGDSSAIASEVFETIQTIELSPVLFSQACQRFANKNSITCHLGDSVSVLPRILTESNKKIVFWLDGHWSGGQTAKGLSNTPILQELDAIKQSRITDSIILIDDIRLFQKSVSEKIHVSLEGYPTLELIINATKQINPKYSCWIYGDTLIAYTEKNIKPTPMINAMTISRLNTQDEEEILKSEKIIAHASEQDAMILKQLCLDFENDGGYGFNCYYHFWYALTLMNNNKSLAHYHMQKAAEGGCKRAEYYLSLLG